MSAEPWVEAVPLVEVEAVPLVEVVPPPVLEDVPPPIEEETPALVPSEVELLELCPTPTDPPALTPPETCPVIGRISPAPPLAPRLAPALTPTSIEVEAPCEEDWLADADAPCDQLSDVPSDQLLETLWLEDEVCEVLLDWVVDWLSVCDWLWVCAQLSVCAWLSV